MNQNKMYKEMTVYVEACESGSMFENILEDNLNIYAVSAANSSESSWASYCGFPNDVVQHIPMMTCLGDLFSTNWMEDAEKANMAKETLNDQYSTVMKETSASHVLQWGQVSIAAEPIGDFESGNMQKADNWWANLKSKAKKILKKEKPTFDKLDSIVNSRDVTLHNLYAEVMVNPTIENQEALKAEVEHRLYIDALFASMFPQHMEAVKAHTTPLPTNFECYRTLVETFEASCERMDDYSLKYMAAFVAECETANDSLAGVLAI